MTQLTGLLSFRVYGQAKDQAKDPNIETKANNRALKSRFVWYWRVLISTKQKLFFWDLIVLGEKLLGVALNVILLLWGKISVHSMLRFIIKINRSIFRTLIRRTELMFAFPLTENINFQVKKAAWFNTQSRVCFTSVRRHHFFLF